MGFDFQIPQEIEAHQEARGGAGYVSRVPNLTIEIEYVFIFVYLFSAFSLTKFSPPSQKFVKIANKRFKV